MRAVDGKQEIYLGWPNQNHITFNRRKTNKAVVHATAATVLAVPLFIQFIHA